MRSGWSERLRAEIQRRESSAGLIAEVAVIGDSHVKNTRADWTAGTRTGVGVIPGGGVRLGSSSTSRVSHTTATDPTDVVRLTSASPFDAIVIEWLGSDANLREIRNFVARLHPREDAGSDKEVAYWVCEVYRVTAVDDADYRVELVKRRQADAPGETAGDVTFDFAGSNGSYPTVGVPPDGSGLSRPVTIVRIIALQEDGTIAGNVSWEGSSTGGDDKTGAGQYYVRHVTLSDVPGTSGGTSWEQALDRTDLPRFTLNESTYSDGDVEFTGGAEVPDLAGSGDVRVVLRATTPSDSAVRGFVWDGAQYVRCYDGDVLGQDNRVTIAGVVYGGDLSGVPTTGPWDMRVYLDASSDALKSPTVRDFGLEKLTATPLIGAATVEGGGQRIADLTALKGSIAAATVEIHKTGEKDFDDYGSRILSTNHIGALEVRLLFGDLTGERLARSEWMLHSIWEVETYHSGPTSHRVRVLSPLRRLRKPIPPFVTVGGGPAGSRTAVQLSGTIAEVWTEVADTLIGIPSRYIGTPPADEVTTVADTIQKADGKNVLDAIAYLEGSANVESQGRVKAVKVMHDDPADEAVRFRLPLHTYDVAEIGPGFDVRVDEFFVRYNWNEGAGSFDDERRHVNLAALGNLGGAGLNTTQELRDEVARFIRTEALADAVGRRVPKHFGTGELLWHVRPHERMPQLEIGDVGTIETDMLVAKTPVTGRELRGPLATLCVVVGTDDAVGSGLWLWVPSYELITVVEDAVTRSGFGRPKVDGIEWVGYHRFTSAPTRVGATPLIDTGVLRGKADPTLVSEVDIWTADVEFEAEPTTAPDYTATVKASGEFWTQIIDNEEFATVRPRRRVADFLASPPSGAWSLVDTVSAAVDVYEDADAALEAGTDYEYYVAHVDGGTEGDPSNVAAATTLGSAPVPASVYEVGRFRLNVDADGRRLSSGHEIRTRTHISNPSALQFGIWMQVERRVSATLSFNWRDNTTGAEIGGYGWYQAAFPFQPETDPFFETFWFNQEVDPSVDDVRIVVHIPPDPPVFMRWNP